MNRDPSGTISRLRNPGALLNPTYGMDRANGPAIPSSHALYQQVKNHILEQIRSGQWPPETWEEADEILGRKKGKKVKAKG